MDRAQCHGIPRPGAARAVALLLSLAAVAVGLLRPMDVHAAVRWLSFRVEVSGRCIEVRWETASELGNLGFYVWRAESVDGSSFRLPVDRSDEQFVPSRDYGVGAAYAFTDCQVTPGITYYYRIQDVPDDGSEGALTPVQAARVELATPVPLPSPPATATPPAADTPPDPPSFEQGPWTPSPTIRMRAVDERCGEANDSCPVVGTNPTLAPTDIYEPSVAFGATGELTGALDQPISAPTAESLTSVGTAPLLSADGSTQTPSDRAEVSAIVQADERASAFPRWASILGMIVATLLLGSAARVWRRR